MSICYRDYVWKGGIPYGIGASAQHDPLSYKIAMDPYRKRIAIEKYLAGKFEALIYDSALIDFRSLKPESQVAWQKIVVSATEDEVSAMICNQDDRLLLLESYRFLGARCRECIATAPHGCCVFRQKLYYTALGDPFDGVILMDSNEYPVIFKSYQVDPESGEFSALLVEEWDMSKMPLSISTNI